MQSGNGNGNGKKYESGYVPNDLELIRDELEYVGNNENVVYQCKTCHILYIDMDEKGSLEHLERMYPERVIELYVLIMRLNDLSCAINLEVLEENGFPTLSHGSECWCCGWFRDTGEKVRRLQRKKGYDDCFGKGKGICVKGKENELRCFMRRRCISPPAFPEYWLKRVRRLRSLNLFPYEVPFM